MSDRGGDVYSETKPLLAMYDFNYDGSELHKYDIKHILAFNLTKQAFNISSRRWSDLKLDYAKRLLGITLWLHQNPHLMKQVNLAQDLKSVQKDPDGPYYRNGGDFNPRIIVCFEELLGNSQNSLDTFEGYRIWLFIADETINLRDGVRNMIQWNITNKQREDAQKFAKKVTKNPLREFEKITELDSLAYGVWSKYNPQITEQINKIQGGSKDNYGDLYDPLLWLDVTSAMTVKTDGVCIEQTTLGNYFLAQDDVSPRTWKGFPKFEHTCKINPDYFNIKQMTDTPLPNFIKLTLSAKTTQKKQLESDLELFEKELEQARDELDVCRDDETRNQIELRITELEATLKTKRSLVNSITEELLLMTKDVPDNVYQLDFSSDTLSFLEEIFAEHNDILALKMVNEKRFSQIDTLYPQKGPEWQKLVEETRKTAMADFWRVLTTSQKIPKIAIHGMKWWKGLGDERKTVERNIFIADPLISPFGNHIALNTRGFEKVSRLYVDYQIMWTIIYAGGTSFLPGYGLRVNIIQSGDGQVGKSFIYEEYEKLAFNGSVSTFSNITAHAFDTKAQSGENDLSDQIIVQHEAQLEQLGIDKYGKQTEANPHWKNKLTAGYSAVLSFGRSSDGERTKEIMYTRCPGVVFMNTNTPTQASESPLMQRFLHIIRSFKERHDVSATTFENEFSWLSNQDVKNDFTHGWKLTNFYIWIWAKMIEARVAPPISTDVCSIVFNIVFDELCKKGIKYPGRRKIKMAKMLCEVATMIYGVHMEFFSELGRDKRMNEQGNTREFDPMWFLDLPKWGVVTQEIAIWVLTLMQDHWISKFKSKVAKTCALVGERKTVFPIKKGETSVEPDPEDGTIHYIKVPLPEGEISAFAQKVREVLEDRPSHTDTVYAINELKREYISSKPRKWKDDQNNQLEVILEYKRLRSLYKDPPADIDKVPIPDVKADEYLVDSMITRFQLVSSEKVNGMIREYRKNNDKATLEVVNGPERKIPCMAEKSEDVPNKKKMDRFLLISIEYLYKKVDDLLIDALNVLKFKGVRTQKIVTGVNYEDTLGKIPVVYHQFFQTFLLEPSAPSLVIPNRNCYDDIDHAAFYNVSDTRKNETSNPLHLTKEFADIPQSQTALAYIFERNIDTYTFIHYFNQHGFCYKTSKIAIPQNTQREIFIIRQREKEYHRINHQMLDTYPESFVDVVKRNLDKFKRLDIINNVIKKYNLDSSYLNFLLSTKDDDINVQTIDKTTLMTKKMIWEEKNHDISELGLQSCRVYRMEDTLFSSSINIGNIDPSFSTDKGCTPTVAASYIKEIMSQLDSADSETFKIAETLKRKKEERKEVSPEVQRAFSMHLEKNIPQAKKQKTTLRDEDDLSDYGENSVNTKHMTITREDDDDLDFDYE